MRTNERKENEVRGASTEELVARVRERYAGFARGGSSGCCGSGTGVHEQAISESLGYDASELARVPEEADLGLGCGVPIPLLDLHPGEVVLDLGSGAGLDAFLASKRVAPGGRVIGVDMTPEMIDRARQNASRAKVADVEFRLGRLEELPVEDSSIDAVTSNCVINLVPDKGRVFREIARVLRPGGRLVISDIVLDDPLPPAIENDLYAYVGCVSGAMLRDDYFRVVSEAGLKGATVLKDVDFLLPHAGETPAEVRELAERAGVDAEDLRGKVRSVTFRAVLA